VSVETKDKNLNPVSMDTQQKNAVSSKNLMGENKTAIDYHSG